MSCSSSLRSCWQLATLMRALAVLLLAIWMVVMVDFAIETNSTLKIIAAVGCAYSLLVNSYIFFAVKTNVFIR